MPMKYVGASVITAATLAGISADAWAARVDYTVDLGVEDNDNVTLAPFDPIQQRYLRAGLGFTVTENLSALQLSLGDGWNTGTTRTTCSTTPSTAPSADG